ncbi:hypothetical protein HHK36_014516 [Tetracentron sinense]|uniref:Uncharacterized protein n=1 Tax=Tetracentron sinense TaxID=13715 RepID=A0A834Z7H7_TETSI|nr:hypothetical protein HHK36_014516 [Tetracentron sinense]
MLRLIATLSFLWLVMAIAVAQPSNEANPPVLDTAGQALESGVEYYILPDTNQTGGSDNVNGGGLTLVNRNGSCPLYVGQENLVGSAGLPVIFTPFFAGETIIRRSRDFSVYFSASTICVQSTAWKLEGSDPETERRLIVTGADQSYFRVEGDGNGYELRWCPNDVCPLCRINCGYVGVLIENGKRLLALDGPALPVVFRKA